MESIQVELKDNGYPIKIGSEIFGNLSNFVKNKGKLMIITDENIDKIYGEQLETILSEYAIYKYIVPPGEKSKTPNKVVEIVGELIRQQFTRHDRIVAFGGGVIGDLAGFCASIYMRGISFIQIPTTLLSQVDSSVGGKTGVNLPEAKNIIGTFHQPEIVIADTFVLKTLPHREIVSGLGEVIKYGIIKDYDFFTYIYTHLEEVLKVDQQVLPSVVKKCCEIKANIVAEDEKEIGLRKNLNFGHTIGHAIETITEYNKYTHGEAVIIGMYYETKIAHKMDLIDDKYLDEIISCLTKTGVPLDIQWAATEELIQIMGRDKKNHDSKISFILPTGKGTVEEFLLPETRAIKIFSEVMKG